MYEKLNTSDTTTPMVLNSDFGPKHMIEGSSSELANKQRFNDLEEALAAARPRLLHLAMKRGVAADAADDVVQETLLEAWRHLDHLREPWHFDAWLDGICRNVCLRWRQTHKVIGLRQESLSGADSASEDWQKVNMADPQLLDPVEELSRQELARLIDRAMGYLPENGRTALELYYLAELPQREAAVRLGLTINALEVRLHRARRQLRQVLNGVLRTDAEEFGLALDEEESSGWRETRIWCMFCGRRHLQGMLETLVDGRVDLRLRCPDCQEHGTREWIKSGGLFELCELKSFRAAFNRAQHVADDYWISANNRQQCFYCKAPLRVWLMGPGEMLPPLIPWEGFRLVMHCTSCDSLNSIYAGGYLWLHPIARDFIMHHPRWMQEPETLVEYANQPAIRVRLSDVASAAQFTVLFHCETFQVLASFQE